jgi:hypothetical protein
MLWIFLFRVMRGIPFFFIVGVAKLLLTHAAFKRLISERWQCWGGFHDVSTATGYDWYCKRAECQAEWHRWDDGGM